MDFTPGRYESSMEARVHSAGTAQGRDQGRSDWRQSRSSEHMPAPNGIDAIVRERLGAGVHDRYFRGHAKLCVEQGRARVISATRFHGQMLDRRFGAELRAAFGAELGLEAGSFDIEFLIDPALDPQHNQRPEPESPRARITTRVPLRESVRRTATRLDPFIVGESNRLAYDAVQRLAVDRETRLSPLVIHGPCGVGKTHLLKTAASLYRKQHPAARIRFMSSDQFTTEFVSAIREGRGAKMRRSLVNSDLICIDDVHFLSTRDATQAELVQTIDAVSQEGARIVLASDEHPNQIQSLRAALRSRLVAGMVVRVEQPDPVLAEKLIKSFAEREGMSLTPEAISLIPALVARSAGRTSSSVRDLMGAVTQLSAAAKLLDAAGTHGLVGPGLVRQTFEVKPTPGSRSAGSVGMRDIMQATCEELLVDPEDLGRSGRHKRVVLARGLVTLLARELTTLSYPEIARAMGKKGHSTMIMAERRLLGQIEAGETAELGAGCPPTLASITCDELAARVRMRLVI